MKNFKSRIRFISALCILALFTACSSISYQKQPIPLSSEVEHGVLENGLSWFYLQNSEPEQRASLRLVVNAGSILEDDDQKGLAHFCEHMAFNGTENFEKNELIDYLESIGMAFGPEINAYTSFDETVYQLEIPTDDPEILENAFQVLEDWAHLVSYDDEEIEKERNVIREEWRLGRGLSGRIRDKLLPALFRGSHYADRLPIGSMDVVMNAPAQRLRDFYRDWYRPDLMSVVVVGDIEKDRALDLIQKHFSFEGPEEQRHRFTKEIALSQEDDFCIIRDPEMGYANVEINLLGPALLGKTASEYREQLLSQLVLSMINSRFREIAESGDPPFINANSSLGRLVRDRSLRSFSAACDPSKIEASLEALLVEIERVRRHGFTPAEFKRVVDEQRSRMDDYYADRENIHSANHASELADYFLSGKPYMGAEDRYRRFAGMIEDITLAEVNTQAVEMMPTSGRLFTVVGPKDASIPPEEQLSRTISAVEAREIAAYEEPDLGKGLMDRLPEAGEVRSQQPLDGIDALHMSLSNGAEVIVKTTDFREDQVLFSAVSRGGLSLVSDEEYVSGEYASLLASQSGIAGMDISQLRKFLAGKTIGLSPYIGDRMEGINGSFDEKDAEVFMQLLHLYFTDPSFSEASLANLKTRLRSLVQNRTADPMTVYNDRLREILSGGDFRSKPLDTERLKQLDRGKAERVYRDRFGGADDFIFVFVGSMTGDELKPLIERYIGSIPAGEPGEKARDLGVRPPSSTVDETVYRGLEEQARVSLVFSGEEDSWSPELEEDMQAAASILESVLLERVREDLGGSYNIGVSAGFEREPAPLYSFFIGFGCEPSRTDELTAVIMDTIAELAESVDESYVMNREEQYRRAWEENIKGNSFWRSHLQYAAVYGDDPTDLSDPSDYRERLTPEIVSETIARYLDEAPYVRLVLLPEKRAE